MSTETMKRGTAAFLITEANGYRSRDVVTVTVPSGGLEAGTILGKLTATGKYVRHNAGLSTGAEDETAILLEAVTETGDAEMTVIARDAEVNGAHLVYEDGADTAQETTSNTALAALGIIVR